jgi:hypothetical protein
VARNQGKRTRGLLGILTLLVALQALAIGMAIYYGNRSVATDRLLLERTGVMSEKMLPGIQRDVSAVSQRTSEIKGEVSGLRTAVTRVDERVGDLDRGVGHVGRVVDGMNHTLIGFVRDKTSLIWGHSLNPYVLLAALLIIAISIPLSGFIFKKGNKVNYHEHEQTVPEGMESLPKKLKDLSEVIEKIRNQDEDEQRADTEIQRLMLETQRLIEDARAELAAWSQSRESEDQDGGRVKRTLH